MSWTREKFATKKEPGLRSGVCSVCGYTTVMETEFNAIDAIDRVLAYSPYGVGAIALLVLAVFLLRRPKKKAPPKSSAYKGKHEK